MRTRETAAADAPLRTGRQRRPASSAVIIGVLAIVVGAALPLSALLLAGRWATAEVTARTVAGERSTATAVGQQADQSYDDALLVFKEAVGRPSVLRGLTGRDLPAATASLDNLRASGPFADVGLFGPSGPVITQVPAGITAPAPVAGTTAGVVSEGRLRELGARSLRAVSVPIFGTGGRLLGFVTADIDLQRLIPDTAALQFATTGKSVVVGYDNRILIDPVAADVGLYLITPAIDRLAESHRAGTVTVTSVRTHRHVVLVYEPVAGRPWGVLTSQTTAEAFAGVHSLTDRLRLLVAIFGGLGLLLAGLVTVMIATRDRRIRSQTAALAAAKETFHSAFDNAPSGVGVVGLDGRFRQVNPALCELTGYTEDQLLARTYTELTHPADRGPDTAAAQQLAAGHTDRLQLEKRYLRADGQPVWVAVSSSIVTNEQNRPDHFVTHVVDIGERRAATAEIAAARDAAVAATTAKSAFLATMSHEIRTPMNAVIGMTGLLLDTALDAEQRQFTETVRSSGESLITILNDILDFSKIESGDLDLEGAPFEVRDCVESAVEVVALAAQHKNVAVIAEVTDSCPEVVVGDVTRFRQVIVNLTGNAVKFTDTGEVHVMVAAEELAGHTDGPVQLIVSVRDTGVGIPADRMDRLFQAFSQADSSITRTYGGTGLGLVISRRLAHAMGSDLTVVSEPGVGSTFTFTAVLQPFGDRRTAAVSRPDPLDGSAVLLVDANTTSRRVLGHLLRSWGVTVTDTGDAAGALAAIAAGHRFDAALLDTHLPDMNGPRLASSLRALPAASRLPLLLRTDLESGLSTQQRARVTAILAKPGRTAALHDALLEAVHPGEAALRGVETAGGRRGSDGPAIPSRPLRVLLAEDNQVNQKVAQLMLAKLGHRVDTVADGREAVDAARRTAYDVILMDVQMPNLDGLRATEIIREQLPADQQPRIVGMTANVFAEDRAACAAAGMDAHVGKPIRSADLATVLDEQIPTGGLRNRHFPAT